MSRRVATWFGWLGVLGLVAGGCGQGVVVDSGSDGDGLVEALNGHLAFNGAVVWSVERVDPPKAEAADLGLPTGPSRAVHEVRRLDVTSVGELVLDEEGFPSLPSTAVSSVRAVGDSLVVAGEQCVDGSVAAEEQCESRGVVHRLGPSGWETAVIQHGNIMGQLGVYIEHVVDERHVLLLVGSDESGIHTGFLRVALFDVETMKRVWTAEPSRGGTCMIGGVAHSLEMTGGWNNPVVGEASPYDLVPTTYRVWRLDEGTWREVEGGYFDGLRPRNEPMQCLPTGYSTAAVGFDLSYLGWTPSGGWAVGDPAPEIARAARSIPTSVERGNNGQSVVGVNGRTWVQRLPGVFEPLPDVIEEKGAARVMMFNGNSVLACHSASLDTNDSDINRLEECRVFQWR